MEGKPDSQTSANDLLEAQLKDIELKIRNLVELAERGMNLESVATRIHELERQQTTLRSQRPISSPLRPAHLDRKAITNAVSLFFESFERNFDEAPQIEKNELVRKVVERIIVDPDGKKVTVYFRQIPKIDETEEVSREENILLGAACSANGNRTRI